MSSFEKDLEDLQETIRQIELEKSNLFEHQQKKDKNYRETVQNLQTIYENILKERHMQIEKLQLENAELKFLILITKTEEEDTPLVYKVE